MKIYSDTKVYALCPAKAESGGPELLHQVISRLLSLNVEAYMFYDTDAVDPIAINYKKYHLPFVRELQDDAHNVLIVPEMNSDVLYRYENVQRVFWWLSVDNYVTQIVRVMNEYHGVNYHRRLPKFLHFDGASDETIEHWVQSEYARQFVLINGVNESKIKRVGDYLNSMFLSRSSTVDLSEKQNIIAFNPGKGFEFTRKLIQAAPKLAWAPIQNMTPEQVQELLARAKVYIDFGNHPGRDRIPREAAISGCVIITGRRGSAANPIDVAIDDSFKFNNTDADVPRIIARIKNIFEDFPTEYDKQKSYRAEIMTEPELFASEVEAACEFVKPLARPTRVAILQSLSDANNLRMLSEVFSGKSELALSFMVGEVDKGMSSQLVSYEHDGGQDYIRLKPLPIVSTADAAFLYREKRIEKFLIFDQTDDENEVIGKAINQIGCRVEDIIKFSETKK